MKELDFLITAVCFSTLGYGLCYMTFSVHKSKMQNVNSENHCRDENEPGNIIASWFHFT